MPAETLAQATQLVDVVMTLEDINGQLWNNAKVLINFVAPPNTSGPYTWNGGEFQQSYRWEKLAGSSVQVQLQPNMEITPEGWNSWWRFTVSPNADDSRSVTFIVRVAGTAMDLTQVFTARSEEIIQKLVQSFPVPRGKSDVDVAPTPNDGQIYFDTTAQEMKYRSNGNWVEFGTGIGQQGPAGPQGPQGIQGIPGPQGLTGEVGPQGPRGYTGATGPAGQDGKSVTILGSYDTIEDLIAAHPTGNLGDAYMVGADMYVWNGTEWYNVGTIQGPQGEVGPMGPPGATGSTGPQGPIGNTGPQGVPGTAGAAGPTGPIGPAGPTIFPPAGVAVSTGSAWSTSIPANTLATTAQLAGYLPLTGGTLSGPVVWQDPGGNTASVSAFVPGVPSISFHVANAATDQKTTGILGYGNGMALSYFSDSGVQNDWLVGHRSGNTATDCTIACPLFVNGVATIYGNVTATGDLIQIYYNNVPAAYMSGGGGYPSLTLFSFWANSGYPTFRISQTNYTAFQMLDTNNNPTEWLQAFSSGVYFNLPVSVPSLNTGSVSSAGDVGVGGAVWTNAITSPANSLSVSGVTSFNSDVYVAGTIYGGAKNFLVTHPLDPTKNLVHSALEGPEHGVYYRGEAATENGVVEIILPDYFEALTLEEDRTVQLTELIEDEDNPMFGCFLATTKIKNGKFKVRSSVDVAKFYWEVKAVRKDIQKLRVVRDKEEVANATSSNREA